MAYEHHVAQSFNTAVGSYFIDKQPYDQVHVLCIYWEKNDLGPEDEVEELRRCFEEKFRYTVASLAIPGDDSRHTRLINEIMKFVNHYSNEERSLIIIYYAGHCGRNEDGFAEWAAFEQGGPTIQWNVVQQLLFFASGDVLLLLDCCYASLIMKGHKDGGRFELLAASAKKSKTPGPSRYSFSSLLVQELLQHVANGVTVNALASRLREHPKITETPVFHDFARSLPTGIKLQILSRPEAAKFVRKPSGYVVFRASLSEDISGLEIAEWLKTAPPSRVTAVQIEAMVIDARRLQNLVGLVQGSQEIFTPGSLFEKLSLSAKQEIVRAFRNLDTTMTTSSQLASKHEYKGHRESISETLKNIQGSVATACAAIETPVLTQLKRHDFETAYGSEFVELTGTGGSISLYNCYHDDLILQNGKEINRDVIEVDPAIPRLAVGTFNEKGTVVEFHQYDSDPSTSKPYADALRQIEKITNLLCHPKASTLHILPCVGWFHDKPNNAFGVTFRAPPYFNANDKPITLMEMYVKEKRVPLGHRIRLAAELAAAMDDFHIVGWVHKGIRSENIAFLPVRVPDQPELGGPVDISDTFVARQGSIDLADPYFFGFEYMRMGDAGTNLDSDDLLERNLYRHPDRWGKPLLRFEKAHDVYALGIVLAEIAFWQPIEKFAEIPTDKSKKQMVEALDVLRDVKAKCARRLPHQVGQMFYETIMNCLNFKHATTQMNTYEAQIYFQAKIKRRLQMATDII